MSNLSQTAPIDAPSDYQPQFPLWVRQVLALLMILVAIWVGNLIAPVLPMLTIAFLLAFVMFVPSRTLARRTPIPYTLSVLILYIVLILAIILLVVLVSPALIEGTNGLIVSLQNGLVQLVEIIRALDPQEAVFTFFDFELDLSEYVVLLQTILQTSQAQIDEIISTGEVPLDPEGTGDELEATGAEPEPILTPEIIDETQPNEPLRIQQAQLTELINLILSSFGSVTRTVTATITSVTGFFGNLLLAMFISFLILLDVPRMQRSLSRSIPEVYQREFAVLIRKIVRVWNGFFRGQVFIGFFIGFITWVQLTAMGISNAFILAVIVGTISLIPTIGGIIAIIPLGLIPLITGSTTFPELPNGIVALIVVGVNLVISQVIWNVIAPKILGDALDLPLAVIIIGVFVGAAVGGILGAFLVAPIMATGRVLLVYLFNKINLVDPYPNEEAPLTFQSDQFEYIGWTWRRSPAPKSEVVGISKPTNEQPAR